MRDLGSLRITGIPKHTSCAEFARSPIQRAANNSPPSFGRAETVQAAKPLPSAVLPGVTGCDLVFMGREGCPDFALLALRDFEEVQGPSEFCRNLIEFCGGNPEVSMGLLKTKRCRAGLGGLELEGPTRNVASVRMNLRPGSLPSCWCAIPATASSWISGRRWGSSRRRR